MQKNALFAFTYFAVLGFVNPFSLFRSFLWYSWVLLLGVHFVDEFCLLMISQNLSVTQAKIYIKHYKRFGLQHILQRTIHYTSSLPLFGLISKCAILEFMVNFICRFYYILPHNTNNWIAEKIIK